MRATASTEGGSRGASSRIVSARSSPLPWALTDLGGIFRACMWARPAVALNLTAVVLSGYKAEHVNSPLLDSLSLRPLLSSVNRDKMQH